MAPSSIDRNGKETMENPGTGRVRNDLMSSLRSVAEGNCVIFYRPIDDGMLIMRVLHGARDIQSYFRVDEETEED